MAGLVCLLAGACGQKQWHHSRKTLADFNRDACECEILAQNAGKQASQSKSRIVWSAYAKAYDDCLMAAGWSPVSPDSRSSAPHVSAEIKDDRVRGFGLVLDLPKGFALTGQEQKDLGSTSVASFCFVNPQGWSLRLDFQKARAARFYPAKYPVPSGLIRYDQGDFGAPERLTWTVFCGRVRRVWVMGMGAYFRVDETQRLGMTMTAPLSGPKGPRPVGLALAREQRDEVEAFADVWKIWLRENFEE